MAFNRLGVSTCIKLLLKVCMVLVATFCVMLKLSDFLPTPSSFVGRRNSVITTASEPYNLDLQENRLKHKLSELFKYSNNMKQARISLGLTNNKPLAIPPIPDPPPNLPWNQTELRVTTKTLMHLPWVKQLWVFLNTKVDSTLPIAITSTNYLYRSSLLNWLAHALIRLGDKSLKNVLVLSMDKEIHNLLQAKNMPSLFVAHKDLSRVKDGTKVTDIIRAEITRLVVMRLINSWGYDVINYDNDAFVLKNPQELFDRYPDSHVIGSESFMPFDLHAKWGVTLCMGVVLVRASPETELFWLSMNRNGIRDDQKKLNMALNSLNLSFDFHAKDTTLPWQGKAPLIINKASTSLKVTVLPMKKICRGKDCRQEMLPECFVWHQGGGHSYERMVRRAATARVWLLRDDWSAVITKSNRTGKEWIRELMIEN